MERYEKMLTSLGMAVTKREQHANGLEIVTAEMETPRGTLSIYCGSNGTARVDKPNGSHKWYYEKTVGQIRAALVQTIEFNR
jgi:hypothetical protein